MKRIVSGIKPTGTLHIGNYIGAINQLKELQDDYDAYYFIADYHALTVKPKADELNELSLHTAAMLIACGINPKRANVFVQSAVPEHAELAWILSNFTTIGQLNRMTQYKEKSSKHGQSVGLFTYPILMAADVAIYDAEVVPVGDDQAQHLELAREIIRSLNKHIGKTVCREPKPIFSHGARVMSLSDPGKKMSKTSAGSAIDLLDDEAAVIKNIRRAVTDSDSDSETISPALKNLFVIMKTVSSHQTLLHFEKLHSSGKLRYSELKEQLIEDTLAYLAPIQKSYHSLIKDKDNLIAMLEKGNEAAREQAKEKLKEIKAGLGFLG